MTCYGLEATQSKFSQQRVKHLEIAVSLPSRIDSTSAGEFDLEGTYTPASIFAGRRALTLFVTRRCEMLSFGGFVIR